MPRLRLCVLLLFVSVSMRPTLVAQAPPAPAARPQPAALTPAEYAQKADELVSAYVKANGFTGTVLVAKEGKPLVAKGYGYANLEWQIPNAPTTKFRIGSITKQFTSMVIMQLRERGKIKLEDSVCVYLTPCPDTWKPVTIHHLLTHTSGIPTYTGIPSWREANMVPKSIDQMLAIFRDLPLQWVPGERYAYNNSGYFVLGVVIEKVTGKKYEQALQEMIFTPVGMSDTGYDWSRTIQVRGVSGVGDKVLLAHAGPDHCVCHGSGRQGHALRAEPGWAGSDRQEDQVIRRGHGEYVVPT